MFRPRVIPVLLLKGKGLVKTIKFKKPTYIGDPINAVKIFNDLKVDEVVFLDINASLNGTVVSKEIVKRIADEAFMPFAVGGGINEIDQIKELISNGAEKVVLNTSLYSNPKLVKMAVEMFGSQSIIGSIDVKKNIFGKYKVVIKGGKKKIQLSLEEYVKYVESLKVGEILINSIDHDGMMDGYNYDLVKLISQMVDLPVIACGGAGKLEDIRKVVLESGAHAAAAGSLFVYHGARKGVLINYPERTELNELFNG